MTNQYQSNGACFETCKSNYAFAVIQGNTCWCSNYVPANTVSTGLCNEQCPGFGSERCGSSSKGLFGYIALSRSPSGTAGGASSTASSSSPSSDEDRSPTTSMVVSNRSSTRVSPSSSPPPILAATSSSPVTSAVGSSTSFGPFSSLRRSSSLRPAPLGPSSTSSSLSSSLRSPSTLVASSSSRPSPSLRSPSTFVTSTSRYLTTSVQTSSADPSPVTVVQTITASPVVETSIVSIVRIGPLPMH